jgi:hypothetical protein
MSLTLTDPAADASLTLADLHITATSPDSVLHINTSDAHITNCTFTPWPAGSGADPE